MAVPGNPILDASNVFLTVTNKAGAPAGGIQTLDGVPIGTAGASATGELGIKVLSIGSSGTSSNNVTIVANRGAANQATGQVATSTTAATFVAARATRRSVTLANLDSAINVFVGPATVTTANGMRLAPGQSISVDTTALIQVIAASGTPTVAFYETFD